MRLVINPEIIGQEWDGHSFILRSGGLIAAIQPAAPRRSGLNGAGMMTPHRYWRRHGAAFAAHTRMERTAYHMKLSEGVYTLWRRDQRHPREAG
jgi:hypothetical protein